MTRINLLAIEGSLSNSFANIIDAFIIANRWALAINDIEETQCEVKVVSIDGKPLQLNDTIEIHPHFSFDDIVPTDYLIIPALSPEFDESVINSSILEYIQARYSEGVILASVCTGAFLLARIGLFNGRVATTNWLFEKRFRRRYPKVDLQIDMVITETDNIICSGAVSALMHLILKIISNETRYELTSICAKSMLVDPNNSNQAPYAFNHFTRGHGDKTIRRAEQYMLEKVAENPNIDQIAAYVCLSPRHFKRRFKQANGETPLHYLQRLRVQVAKDLLENTSDSIDEITSQIGYEDSSTYRRLFTKHTTISPRAYRDKFHLYI